MLFARNGTGVGAVRSVADRIRAAYSSDASATLVAGEPIKEEPERVARLQHGVEPMPSMMALGATGDSSLAERAGERVGFDLRRAARTSTSHPVLDLALDPSNTVIGTRAFGADPQRVAAMGAAFAAGLQRGGAIPCYKHFPGAWESTAVDSA